MTGKWLDEVVRLTGNAGLIISDKKSTLNISQLKGDCMCPSRNL